MGFEKQSGRKREDKLRLILENVREFAIFSAGLDGRIDEWNPGAERLFGYKEEEILGQPMEILYVPEDRIAGKAEMEKAVAAQTGFSEDERWHLRKDGSRMFLSGMVNAMYDQRRKLCGYIKVARDITPRKLLQDRLAASEAYHRLLLESIEDFAVITLDEHGKILGWNRGAVATYGYQPDEVVGQNHKVLFTPQDRDEGLPERTLQETLREGATPYERWCLHKDGMRIFTLGAYRRIRNETVQPHIILNVSRDITHRQLTRLKLETTQRDLENARGELEEKVSRRTAALGQTIESLERVLYHVAHDLRAPLRTMEGFASILFEKCSPVLDEEAKRLTDMISDAAKRMDRLIHDLLVYGRLCHEPVRREKVKLQIPVEAALMTLETQVSQTQANIEICPPFPPVWGDTNVIHQVLYELLSNALTFVAPNHKPHVRVWAQRIGGNVRLWIGDNGIGISAEHLERIFGLFEQLSHERRSGTGMGLAIARKGVERMGGQLGAESTPGAGSRFWLDLPAVMEEQG